MFQNPETNAGQAIGYGVKNPAADRMVGDDRPKNREKYVGRASSPATQLD